MEAPRDAKQLRLIILSNQVLFRTSLARLLAGETGFEVVHECGTFDEALEYIHDSPVDIILLDLTEGSQRASDFISAARSAGYEGRFLVMAEAVETQGLATTLKLGASGVFLKSEAPDRLVLAIRLIAAGAVWVDRGIIQMLGGIEPPNQVGNQKSALGERESKVISGVMEGLTTKKIGVGMGLSESKVKNILQGLFAKTGVRKRSQLVRMALEGSIGTDWAKREVGAITVRHSDDQSLD
jgi:two-component system, NarL family, nitrate/nitrite response regulator NarL